MNATATTPQNAAPSAPAAAVPAGAPAPATPPRTVLGLSPCFLRRVIVGCAVALAANVVLTAAVLVLGGAPLLALAAVPIYAASVVAGIVASNRYHHDRHPATECCALVH